MRLRHNDGKIENIEPKKEIEENGDWNFNCGKGGPYTKPIAIFHINGHRTTWKHDEILDLIELFHETDMKAAKMILDPNINTGKVRRAEEAFVDKVQNKIWLLQKKDKETIDKISENWGDEYNEKS